MHKYLWAIPLLAVALIVAGCHGEGARVTVTITAPAAGAEIDQGTAATITVQVTSATGVDKVEFAVDGTLLGTDTTEPYSYSWDTTGASLGTHTITVTVYDQSTPVQTATATRDVTIKQPPTAPPTVEITKPNDGDIVSGDFDIDVTATPVEPGATIDHIDITSGTTKKTIPGASGTVSFNVSELSATSVSSAAAPAQAWTVSVANATVALTAHTITATAVDSFGATGSDSITVNTSGTATVSVNLSDTSGVAGFAMTINYDASDLEVVGGDAGVKLGESPAGAAAAPMLMVNTATPGVITAAVAGTKVFDSTKTQILTIEFRAIGAAGATTVSIDDTAQAATALDFRDEFGAAITPLPTTQDGTVTIQ